MIEENSRIIQNIRKYSRNFYIVFRWRTRAPSDSHSFFVTQIRLKLPSDAKTRNYTEIIGSVTKSNLPKIDPPIHVEYNRS